MAAQRDWVRDLLSMSGDEGKRALLVTLVQCVAEADQMLERVTDALEDGDIASAKMTLAELHEGVKEFRESLDLCEQIAHPDAGDVS